MIGTQSAVFSLVLVAGLEAALLSFPPDFKFGAASAAYQVEGAWNVSDKSPNIWDDFTHRRRDKIDGRGDGDVACDSYHQWRRDIEIAEELGLDFYRFSISWSRICPNGFCNRISEDGKAYYSRLIDGLLEKGIEPVVTLYHWDLPLRLQQLGGWANPLIIDWFAWYARVVYTLYADRVKTWITINEPLLVCDGVYTGAFSPMIDDPMVGVYLCTKNVLLAHAKAWRIYHEEFKPKYKGQASVSNHLIWYEPESSKERELTDLVMEQNAGRFSHAIFSKEGGWPPALERLIAENSKRQGYSRTRLPPFTRDEVELVKGTYDFYGLNFYTSRVVRHARPGEEIGSFPIMGSVELGAVLEAKPEWKKTTAWWLTLNAKGLRDQLVWLKQQYGDVPIVITENGVPSQGNQLDDKDRVQFFKEFLTQVLLAIKKDGVKVLGYTAWSLMDNFEWMDGYTHKFGLYEVNFTDPLRPRTPRSSARYYSHVISTHALDQSETGDLATWYAIVAVFLGVVAALAGFCYCNNKKKKVEYASVAPGEEMKLKTPYNQ